MRLAILISLAALGLCETASGDGGLTPCEVGPYGGYLVSAGYSDAHRVDILATLPDEPEVLGFWTVSEQIAIVADRSLREKLEDAIKDPKLLFPNLTPGKDTTQPDSLEYQRNELRLTLAHYRDYARQYVGLNIAGQRVVLVNYAWGHGLDPADGFIFIHRVFAPGIRFLQCRFIWDTKTISHVSLYGTWQDDN